MTPEQIWMSYISGALTRQDMLGEMFAYFDSQPGADKKTQAEVNQQALDQITEFTQHPEKLQTQQMNNAVAQGYVPPGASFPESADFQKQQAKDAAAAAENTPDAAGNTPSGKITTPVSDVLGRVPTLAGAENYARSVAAGAPQLIPGAGTLSTTLSDADIAQQVAEGKATSGKAYNTMVSKGEAPKFVLDYLHTNANVPQSWVPNTQTQQPPAATQPQAQPSSAAIQNATLNNPFLPKLNVPSAQAQATGTLGNGVRENLPYNGGPATMENLPFNPQTDSAQMQPLASYPAGSWQEYAAQAAQTAGLPPSAVVNLLTGEGSGAVDPNSGATWGILPSTAKGMGTSIEAIRADPHLGIDTAVQYLASNAPMFGGDVQKTLASYFIGAGNVQKAETQAQQNGTDWLTEANKIAAQYGQGTVSDFFASHNLTGDSGTGAGSDITGGVTGSTGNVSTQGHWTTGSDGSPLFVPGTPKTQQTLEEQQATQRATNAQLRAQEQSALDSYKASHPGANVYATTKQGSYSLEDPKTGLTWALQFDPSTGQIQEGQPVYSSDVQAKGLEQAGGAKGLGATDQQIADAAVRGALNPGGLADLGAQLGVPNDALPNILGALSGSGFSYTADPVYAQNKLALGSTGKLYQDVSLPARSPSTIDYIRQANGQTDPTQQMTGNVPAYLRAESLGGLAAGTPSMNQTERNLYDTYGASLLNPALAGNTQAGGFTSQTQDAFGNVAQAPQVGGIASGPGSDPGAGQRIAAEIAAGAAAGNSDVLGQMSNADLRTLGQLTNEANQNAGGGPGTGRDAPVDPSQFVPYYLDILKRNGLQVPQSPVIQYQGPQLPRMLSSGGGFEVNRPKFIIDARTGKIEDVIGEGLDSSGRSIPERVNVTPSEMPQGGLAMMVRGAHGYAYGTDPYTISPTEQYALTSAAGEAQHQKYIQDAINRQTGNTPALPQISNEQMQAATSAGTPYLSDLQAKALAKVNDPMDQYNLFQKEITSNGNTQGLADYYGAQLARERASGNYRWALAGLQPPTEVGVPNGLNPLMLGPGLVAKYNPTMANNAQFSQLQAQYSTDPAALSAEIDRLSAVPNPDYATLQRLSELRSVQNFNAQAAYNKAGTAVMFGDLSSIGISGPGSGSTGGLMPGTTLASNVNPLQSLLSSYGLHNNPRAVALT